MSAVQDDSQSAGTVDADIGEAFSELFEQMIERMETVARRFEMPAFCLKALHMLNAPMAMKELGQRFHCDPSFVTSIADLLDSRGLGRREPDSRDRRIKRLLLTPKGLALRERVERELFDRMPWTTALEGSERAELLRLLRKMVTACREQQAHEQETSGQPAAAGPPGSRPRTPRMQKVTGSLGAGRTAASPGTLIMPPVPIGGTARGR